MVKTQKYVFLQAFLVAAFLFSLGMLIGAIIENLRASSVDELYLESQISLTDLRLKSDILSNSDFNCEKAIKENIDFANRIYSEALSLEKYDDSSKISNKLKIAHKRYDILRTLLWFNNIKIKEKCLGDFHTVVYFYDYLEPQIKQKATQNVISRVLLDLKNQRQEEIILIPIAADLDIYSLDLMMATYNITELPTVLIDEKIKLTKLDEIKDINKYLT